MNLDSIQSAKRIGILDSMNNETMPIVPAIIMRILKSMAPSTSEMPNSMVGSLQKRDNQTEKTTADPSTT